MKSIQSAAAKKTKQMVSKSTRGPGDPGSSKTERRKEYQTKLNPQNKEGLVKYITKEDATLGPLKKMNKGGTTIGIVGGKGTRAGKSSRELRKETGYTRAQRIKQAASITGQTEKRVRATSPTLAGAKLRRAKKDIKEAFKSTHRVLSARVTGCGGSAKACKTRQGKGNFGGYGG